MSNFLYDSDKEDFNIDLESSWMVGDSENDIRAGQAAGCRTALIGEGAFGQDRTVESLAEFAENLPETRRSDEIE